MAGMAFGKKVALAMLGTTAGGAAGNIGVGLGVGVPQQIRYQEINSVPLGVIQPLAAIGGNK